MGNIHATVLAALHQVPPVHLTIYELWRELADEDGQVDTLQATERAEEILTAVAQAQAYVSDTQAVLRHMQQLVMERQ